MNSCSRKNCVKVTPWHYSSGAWALLAAPYSHLSVSPSAPPAPCAQGRGPSAPTCCLCDKNRQLQRTSSFLAGPTDLGPRQLLCAPALIPLHRQHHPSTNHHHHHFLRRWGLPQSSWAGALERSTAKPNQNTVKHKIQNTLIHKHNVSRH